MNGKRSLEARKGLYYEEFEAGQTVTSSGRTVTEADVVAFAALTGDWASIHTDATFAAQHPFGQRVAHGMLGASFATAMAMRMGFLDDTILAFREIRGWKFSLPIHLGDTIRVRISVNEKRPIPRLGGGLVTFHAELVNQYNQSVQHGIWVVLVKIQEDPPPEVKSPQE